MTCFAYTFFFVSPYLLYLSYHPPQKNVSAEASATEANPGIKSSKRRLELGQPTQLV